MSHQVSDLVELYHLKNSHPEIPSQDPVSVLSIVAACSAEAAPGDTLGILFHGEDVIQLFLAYRIAYVLYPRTVASFDYQQQQALKAMEKLNEASRPTLWLVFTDGNFAPPAGSRIVARLPMNALLFRRSAQGLQ